MVTERIAPLLNGTWTITSPKGGHRTFNVAHWSPDKDTRQVSVLAGPDNTRNYQGFGFVKPNGIVIWKRLRGPVAFSVNRWSADYSAHEKFAHMVWNLLAEGGNAQQYLDLGYEVHGEAACFRCGRKLTTPESIERGIGPVCEAKLS